MGLRRRAPGRPMQHKAPQRAERVTGLQGGMNFLTNQAGKAPPAGGTARFPAPWLGRTSTTEFHSPY